MHTSTVAQLKRDSEKSGAYQAKLAYVQYLQNLPASDNDEIQNLLDDIDTKAPKEYQNLANLLQAKQQERIGSLREDVIKYLRKIDTTSKYYPLACKELCRLYENFDQVRYQFYKEHLDANLSNYLIQLPVLATTAETPEYTYKYLRIKFDTQDLLPNQYICQLDKLLHSAEVTDTLEAKIRFQIMRANLTMSAEGGANVYAHIRAAKEQCEKFSLPHLKSLPKATKVTEILRLLSEKEAIIAKVSNYVDKQNCAKKEMNNLLDDILTMFIRKRDSVAIKDNFSSTALKVSPQQLNTHQTAGLLAYARAIYSAAIFELTCKTSLNGKEFFKVPVTGNMTLKEVNATLFSMEKKTPYASILFFNQQHASQESTLNDLQINQESTLTRMVISDNSGYV